MECNTLTVPIFPLPETVFFPDTLMHLHVFEPRYKQMMADVLSGEGLLGVVQLRPGWEADYYGCPAVYKLLGVGRVLESERLIDGRYNVTLEGVHRVQIVRESMRGEYRVAETEVLREYVPLARTEAVEPLYGSLLKVMDKLLGILPEAAGQLRPGVWPNPAPGVLADLLAHLFMEDAYEKQCVLGELDVLRRLQLVNVQMQLLMKPR